MPEYGIACPHCKGMLHVSVTPEPEPEAPPAPPGQSAEEVERLIEIVEEEARWLKEHGHPTSIKKGFRFWCSGDRLDKALANLRKVK